MGRAPGVPTVGARGSAVRVLLWALAFVILVVVIAGSTVIDQLRDTTFHPTPSDTRVARLATVGVRQYLDGWRTRTPDVLLVCGAGMTVVVLAAGFLGLVAPVWSGVGLLTLAFALSVRVATTAMERRVLAHPQPATELYTVGQGRLRADLLPCAPRATAGGRPA